MSDFLTQNGIILSIVLAALGLAYAVFLIKKIVSSSPGNDAMKRVAAAIQEGASAYLSRQVRTVSIIAVVITALLFWWKKSLPVPAGFLLGAICSMIAGYIGISKQTIYTIVGLVGGGQMPEVPDGVAAAPAPQATVRKADQRRLRRLLW